MTSKAHSFEKLSAGSTGIRGNMRDEVLFVIRSLYFALFAPNFTWSAVHYSLLPRVLRTHIGRLA